MFRELVLLPYLGENTYTDPWIGFSPFYRTQHSKYFHLKMGAEPAPET
jgi:hypothetical protein